MNGVELNRPYGFISVCGAIVAAFLCALLVGNLPSTCFAQDDNVPPGMKAPTFDGDRSLDGERRVEPLGDSFLTSMIRTSGIFGFLILMVLFVMVAIIMIVGMQLRRENFLPTSFIEQFEQRLQAKDLQGAYETARNSDSFIGRILAAGMARLPRSFEDAEAGMQEVGDDETMAMEHKIGYLALIGSIAPMLGLLGTVQGMVYSFQAIAHANTSPKPSDLADGIATSLFTTLEGLVVAIPAIIFYTLYKNRLARFLMECGYVANNLMKDFQHTKPAARGGAAPTSAVAAKHQD